MWLKFLILFSIVVLFIGSSFMVLFNGGKILNQIIKIYFHLGECIYYPVPYPVTATKQQPCQVSYDNQKREIADGVSYLLISLPVAIFFGRKIYKEYDKMK